MRKKSEMQKANEEFVKTYDDSKYPKPSVTADIVIFGMFDKEEDNYRKIATVIFWSISVPTAIQTVIREDG